MRDLQLFLMNYLWINKKVSSEGLKTSECPVDQTHALGLTWTNAQLSFFHQFVPWCLLGLETAGLISGMYSAAGFRVVVDGEVILALDEKPQMPDRVRFHKENYRSFYAVQNKEILPGRKRPKKNQLISCRPLTKCKNFELTGLRNWQKKILEWAYEDPSSLESWMGSH